MSLYKVYNTTCKVYIVADEQANKQGKMTEVEQFLLPKMSKTLSTNNSLVFDYLNT